MIIICIAVILFLCYISVCFRVIITHPIKTVTNAVPDLLNYFRYRKWNNCRAGVVDCYVGLFGKGKTLSAVHRVCGIYRRYNNRTVYDSGRGKWVTQKINVISNVSLNIPYIEFTGLRQFVDVANTIHDYDKEHDTLTCTVFLGDEFSVQLNSRSFKTNIDALFLNTLLTCRHHHISLIYTSQRFNHVDALMRQITQSVIDCDKVWRIMCHKAYDAYELENAATPALVMPRRRFGWFITNADYNAYDTLACVGNLIKACDSGEMLTEKEILELQQNNGVNMEAVERPSRRFIKNQRKLRKK